MPESVNTNAGFKVIVNADHRNGICIDCNTQMEVKKVWIDSKRIVEGEEIITPKEVDRPVCPNCGGMKGQLIVRPFSIQAPAPPQCLKFKCLYKFLRDSLFIAFLSSYHSRRVAYAQANRPEKKTILERYRTGEPSPKTIWQAIHANLKLKCPICRKYNRDPLLFRR